MSCGQRSCFPRLWPFVGSGPFSRLSAASFRKIALSLHPAGGGSGSSSGCIFWKGGVPVQVRIRVVFFHKGGVPVQVRVRVVFFRRFGLYFFGGGGGVPVQVRVWVQVWVAFCFFGGGGSGSGSGSGWVRVVFFRRGGSGSGSGSGSSLGCIFFWRGGGSGSGSGSGCIFSEGGGVPVRVRVVFFRRGGGSGSGSGSGSSLGCILLFWRGGVPVQVRVRVGLVLKSPDPPSKPWNPKRNPQRNLILIIQAPILRTKL